MKDILFIITLVVAIGASVVLVRNHQEKFQMEKSLQQERYSRLVAEENFEKNESKIKQMDLDLKLSQEKIVKIQKILDEEKNVNEDLKTQYEKLVAAKSEMEVKLKEAIESRQTDIAEQKPAPEAAQEAPEKSQAAAQ